MYEWTWTLTLHASPSGDIAGIIVGEEEASLGETSSHDGVGEGDRGSQLDQCNVITGENRPTVTRKL